jgi:peptidoglycan/xylan/chitin deacetylase (PgdA/CDA1 family)
MQHHSTRRKFIATLGVAGTVSLAGCSAIPDDFGSSNPTGTPSSKGPNPTSPGTTTSGGDGGNSSSGKNNGNEKNKKKAPFTRGKVVDDFEGDVGSRWGKPDYGTYKITKKDTYEGSQSLVLEPRKPSKRKKSVNRPYARISRFFTGSEKALDLSNHDLTMAVKVEKPDAIDITANLHAPTGSIALTSTRQIPTDMDDWVRYDLGYTSKNGKPNLSKVLQLELVVTVPPKGPKNFKVKVDDIRKIPKPKKGKIMLQFDDGHSSAYKKAYPVLQQKGWPAACAIIPSAIGAKNRLSLPMMNKMSKNGWDMMSHPPASPKTALPGLPPEVQRRKIEQAHSQLIALGFEKGARHLVAPYNRLSGTTIDILRDVHETTFLFGGCPNNAQQPSNPYFISRVQGSSARGAKRIIDMAAQFNQLAVVTFHVLGGKGTSLRVFKDVVTHVEKKNVDVITPSQLIDRTK